MRALLCLAAVVFTACVATKHHPDIPIIYPKAWIDLFEPPYENCPTIMMAIECTADDVCYIPAGSNGAGFDIYFFGGDKNGQFQPMNINASGFSFFMAIGVGGTKMHAQGAAAGIGLGEGMVYLSGPSGPWKDTQGLPFMQTQDIRADLATGKYILSPNGFTANGIVWSTDGGKTVTTYNMNGPLPVANCSSARYAAIASPTTWYVTWGNWPENANHQMSQATRIEGTKAWRKELSARVAVGADVNGKFYRTSTNMAKRHVEAAASGSSSSGGCDYSAAIMKTTDGGRTWTTPYMSATNFYFNGIDCASETHCIAVGEGFDQDAAGHIFTTTDGHTWTETLRAPGNSSGMFSFMSVRFRPGHPNEAWVGGAFQSQTDMKGVFYFTADGGHTWTQHGELPFIGEITDISFRADGTGFATAMTAFDDSTVLRYTGNGAPATPAPTWNGNFSQKACNDTACSQQCQTFSFAQGVCLELNGGGSATAHCDNGEGVLIQTIYPLSNTCTGPAEMQPQPLNTCIQASNGGSFENMCGPTAQPHEPAKPKQLRRGH